MLSVSFTVCCACALFSSYDFPISQAEFAFPFMLQVFPSKFMHGYFFFLIGLALCNSHNPRKFLLLKLNGLLGFYLLLL